MKSIVASLFSAINEDAVEKKAIEMANLQWNAEPPEKLLEEAQTQLVKEAASVFNGKLIEIIDTIRQEKEQILHHDQLDALLRAEWDADAQKNAEALSQEFANWLLENKDHLAALSIFYSQPFRRREITFAMLKEVIEKLRADAPRIAPLRVWQAYSQLENYRGKQPINELTALVALIRRACGIDTSLSTFEETVRRNFQDWIMARHAGAGEKFNELQMAWLQMIRDHVCTSFHLEREDLDMAPFDREGGLGKIYQLFGESLDGLIEELNEALVA